MKAPAPAPSNQSRCREHRRGSQRSEEELLHPPCGDRQPHRKDVRNQPPAFLPANTARPPAPPITAFSTGTDRTARCAGTDGFTGGAALAAGAAASRSWERGSLCAPPSVPPTAQRASLQGEGDTINGTIS